MSKRDEREPEIPEIDEIAGYVNQERAMATMGITSSAYLADLVRKGIIKAVKWNSRTLMYDKRSVEKYRRERSPRHHELQDIGRASEQEPREHGSFNHPHSPESPPGKQKQS